MRTKISPYPLEKKNKSSLDLLLVFYNKINRIAFEFTRYMPVYSINISFLQHMVEPLLSGIVLGLVPVTLAGLFLTAFLQYRRGDRVTSAL